MKFLVPVACALPFVTACVSTPRPSEPAAAVAERPGVLDSRFEPLELTRLQLEASNERLEAGIAGLQSGLDAGRIRGLLAIEEARCSVALHNMANARTAAFKRQMLRSRSLPSVDEGGLSIGAGVEPAEIVRDESQGALLFTGEPFDMAISGAGYFQLQLANGEVAYTRDGGFRPNAEGTLITADGNPLNPPVTVPNGATEIMIEQNGTLCAIVNGALQQFASVQIVTFPNPAGLKDLGHNLLGGTIESGPATPTTPGQAGSGGIRQSFLEGSNVSVESELLDLVESRARVRALRAALEGDEAAPAR